MAEEREALGSNEPVSIWRMLELAIPEARILAVATLALLVSAGLSLAYPLAVKWMVDTVVTDGDITDLNFAAAALVLMFLVQAVFTGLRSWLFTVAGERVVAKLRSDLYGAIIRQDIAFFDREKTGELTNRLASDTTVLQNTVTVNISMFFRYVVGAIGGTAMLMYMSPRLAGVSLLVVPFVAIGAVAYGRVIRRISKDVQDALAKSTDVAQETLSGIRTVRSFAREAEESARYSGAVDASYRLAAKRAGAVGLFSGFAGFAGYCTVALVVWYGGHLVMDPAVAFSMGDLTAFLLYTGMVAISLGSLASLYGDFMRASGASARVFQLIDRVSELEAEGDDVPEDSTGAIDFIGVHFSYPSRPDVVVLQDFSVELAPGRVVALAGHSGSGKSTVAALLARFYDPQQGSITLDGRDIREFDPRSLRNEIGVVSQEPILFATSIADNIRYGRPAATMEEVREAAEAANAVEFIDGFPDGFDTLVGERGVRLSGGQKQRVAIARALLKDPRILVLDEATSALDAESEHLVQEALDRLMEGRTTLVIAHRLSTIQSADRVLVLDAGRVAEQGTHDELVQLGGLYHRLVERQFGVDPHAVRGTGSRTGTSG